MIVRTVLMATARAVLVLLVVSLTVFVATDLLPSDAALARTSGRAGAEQLAALRVELGLDRPVWRRYLSWLGGLLGGDGGVSLVTGRPVTDLVGRRLPATLALTGSALVLMVPLTLLLAWLVGRRPACSGALVGVAAVPQVVFAAGLVTVFAGLLRWLPPVSLLPAGATPLDRPHLLVLPALSLALPIAAFGAGLLGGAVSDVLRRPHVSDAVLRGVPGWRVATRHVLPFLLAPAVRVLAIGLGALLAGAAVIETMFGYAGLGELLVSSVATRDVPVVAAVAMLAAAVVVAGLALADVVATLTDPYRRRR